MTIECEDLGEFEVDLKWACWSTCPGYWGDHAPSVYRILAHLNPGQQITVRSFPRKECRGLNVTVSRLYPSMWTATGAVWTSWDETRDLMTTLNILPTDDEECEQFLQQSGGDYLKANELAIAAGYAGITDFDAFNESVPYSRHTREPGLDREFDLKANTFLKLMRRIDREEDLLIKEDHEEWKMFENMYRER